ncbi:Metal tolerance protein C2 [Bienertia sinuspersici]
MHTYKMSQSISIISLFSAVTNLLVNLVGVWFFRNYARRNLAYRNAEDMNYHSVCLHVIADSIRRIQNAEVLCMGLVSVAVFMLVMPLFKATGGVLLQMAPPSIPSSANEQMFKTDVTEVGETRFWELVPGYLVGSLSLQLKMGVDDQSIRLFVHGLYHDLGVQDFTLQINYV